MKRFTLTLLTLCLLAGQVWGATYHYVNPELTTGTADGSSWANAWKTFATVGWSTLATEAESQPVYLYVKKGTVSRSYLYPGSWNGGSSDTNRVYITTDATDTGADPIIRVSTNITGTWTAVGSGVYSIQPTGWARDSNQCWQDINTPLQKGTNATLSAGQFWIDTATTPDTLYVNCTDSADPSTHTIDLSNNTYALYLYSVDYVTVSGLVMQHGDDTGYGGVRLYTTDHVTIDDCEVGPNSGGIQIRGTNNTITRNNIHHNWNAKAYGSGGGGGGVNIHGGGGGGNVISKNLLTYNYEGIGHGATYTGVQTISSNLLHHNLVNDINTCGTETYPLYVYNNTIWHNPDESVYASGGHGYACQVASDDVGIVLRNNIIVTEEPTNEAQCVLLGRSTFASVTIDYNDYHLASTGGIIGTIASNDYATLGDWQTALAAASYSGAEAHGLSGDPLFLSSTDFHLQPNSPALWKRATLGAPYDTDFDGLYFGHRGAPIGAYSQGNPRSRNTAGIK